MLHLHREEIVDALLELNAYDWLVFTSPNGVTAFFEYFFKSFHDMRDIGGARILLECEPRRCQCRSGWCALRRRLLGRR